MAERLISLISGGGTTMEQIGIAIRDGGIPGLEFAGVIASEPGLKGISRAHELKMGVPVAVINPLDFTGDDGEPDNYGFGQAILKFAKQQGATVLTQNGWLPWTPDNVIEAYKDAIFNQHPGPLPETRNLHGTQPHAVMHRFARLTGRYEGTEVVAHRVVAGMDEGVLVGVRRVPQYFHDWPKKIQQRALPVEHRLQIDMLNQFVKGEIKETQQEAHFMRPGEEKTLREARKYARKTFPNG